MYIDFKITTWERIHIEDESIKDKIVTALKSGKITSADDVYELDKDANRELLYDVEEQMTIEENDGFSTIEAYDEEGALLYQNGIS
jgi:hypothetical protein